MINMFFWELSNQNKLNNHSTVRIRKKLKLCKCAKHKSTMTFVQWYTQGETVCHCPSVRSLTKKLDVEYNYRIQHILYLIKAIPLFLLGFGYPYPANDISLCSDASGINV